MERDNTTWDKLLPKSVELVEVGPRDGFQILPDYIDTPVKIAIIESLVQSGIRRMEVTSFVHPRAVPQMRDAGEVVRGLQRTGCQYFAMVPNLKGAERALQSGIDMLNLVVSASESHNSSNVRRAIDESLAGFPPVIQLAEEAGVPIRASMSTVFGCPFEGDVPIAQVIGIGRRLIDMGCVELNLCDTTGMANPRQVAAVSRRVLQELGSVRITLHFHNTRGMGAANLLAAMQNGIRSFEASFGGIGGCPFAPGAAGNVATEDMVHMLGEMDIDTGIDLVALVGAVRQAESLLDMTFPGQVIKAGRSCDLHPLALD